MAQENHVLRHGLTVGIIGFASVALLYGALDLIAGRGMLYTVDLLGKSVFLGLRDPTVLSLPMQADPMAIFSYSTFHLLASLAIGLVVTGLVDRVERDPRYARLALFIIVAGFVVTIGGVGLLTSGMRPVLPWWSIVVSNTLAVIAAGTYLLKKRPGTWERLSPFGA